MAEPGQRPVAVIIVGTALLLVLLALVWQATRSNGNPTRLLDTAVDSTAPPKRQFEQLVTLVSTAAERGDAASAREFSLRAVRIFESLPTEQRDVDSRYHVAMMLAVAGDPASALAHADTILADVPDNLFGYYVRGVVAGLGGDSAGETVARAEFTARFDPEMAKARPEYVEHRILLEAFLRKP
ncbi:MAG: hypothetical protein SGI84_07250 [Gemmatimonadota bacterium]|nr:hypothetical protein [Gemmatimonadota bacterium]